MKNGKTCPKCGCSHILRVEDGADSTGAGAPNSFPRGEGGRAKRGRKMNAGGNLG